MGLACRAGSRQYATPAYSIPAACVQSCVLALVASHVPVAVVYSIIEMLPSEEAAARMRPSSCGAQAMLLMEAVCRVPGVM